MSTVSAGFRLSTQQVRTWSQQSSLGSCFRTESELLIRGPLSVSRLQQSVGDVVRSHEILRTVFHRHPGLKTPFQVIRDEAAFLWRCVDLQGLEESAQRSRIRDYVRDQRAESVLETGPLLTVLVAVLGPDTYSVSIGLPALCADKAGMLNLVSAIGRNYDGDSAEKEPEVLQYADIVEWQEELLAGEDTRAGREFWRAYCRRLDFRSRSAILAPFEKITDSVFAPAALSKEIDVSLLSRIKAVCSEQETSVAEFLLAVWRAFLVRITGETTLTIGCELDGRKYSELEDAIGAFARNLPLEFSVDAPDSFDRLLDQTKTSLREAHNWQESFAWSGVDLPSGVDQSPVLPITFDYSAVPAGERLGGAEFTITRLETCGEQFQIKLSVRERSESATFELQYDASRFDVETIERWSGHFATMLRAAAGEPATPVGRLPLLKQDERDRLLLEWNQTAAEYPKGRCLHQLFEDQAARTPDRAAVRCEEQRLSYRELNEQANQLAHALRRAGVGPDALVGLCLERGIGMIVALLGILKAGGAYVPLSADNPRSRLSQQMAAMRALITEEKLLDRLPEFEGNVFCLDRDRSQWLTESVENPESGADPEDSVYVIYTSGSTGTPKGVTVRHRNLVNYAWFIRQRLQLDQYPAGLAFATVSTLSADLGNTCIYPSLISGGCLHVIPYEVSADSQRFRAYNERYPIDVIKIVPSHFAALLDSGAGLGDNRLLLPRRFLIFGGEALTESLLTKVRNLKPDCEIVNHYGPTETTVGSLTNLLRDYVCTGETGKTAPIGKPIANTRVYILDSHLQPVPIGVTGELYIGGDGVTAGYLGQPEMTAERFSSDPFSGSGARMYRTGDVARFLPDGNVEFLGRADDQVKIRGFRVELGEVASVLTTHAAVKQAVVVARADERGEARLVGYVVRNADQSTGAEILRDHVRALLPEYMVPSAIVVLPKLPLNANGKIDRRSLPEPEQARPVAHTYVAPATPTEIVVAGIWEEVLRRDRIGAEDNFFEIGGHSLLATQVISRIRRSLEIDPPLRLLFESPTVAGLAAALDQARREADSLLPPPITRVPRDRPLPLSFAQQRLWVTDRMNPNSALYNVPRGLRIKGNLNTAALERAVNEIVRRHESQRTTFAVRNGDPVQVIADGAEVPVPLRDLTYLPETDREPAARRIAAEDAARPFDLEKGPLLRTQLLRLSTDHYVFLFTAHHIISDAWSAGIFLRELGSLYEAFSQGKPSTLPELAVQYADYAVWQRNWLQGKILDKHLSYWRENLRGAPPVLALPTDRPRSQDASFRGSCEVVGISPDVYAALKALARKEDVTLFMTLLAGFQVLLSRYSGEDQIVVGTDFANRNTTEAEALIGFFINVMPLRTDLSGNPSFRETLRRVRTMALGAYAHQDMPFDKLVDDLQPERSSSWSPLVQALFVMQNAPSSRRELAGLELSGFESSVTQSKFDVAVFMAERDEASLTGYWVYRTDLFDRTTILRIARNFETLLRNAAGEPDARLNTLEIMTDDEKLQRETEQKARKDSQYRKLMTTQPKNAGLSSPRPGGDY